jgi:hypothetical protein
MHEYLWYYSRGFCLRGSEKFNYYQLKRYWLSFKKLALIRWSRIQKCVYLISTKLLDCAWLNQFQNKFSRENRDRWKNWSREKHNWAFINKDCWGFRRLNNNRWNWYCLDSSQGTQKKNHLNSIGPSTFYRIIKIQSRPLKPIRWRWADWCFKQSQPIKNIKK